MIPIPTPTLVKTEKGYQVARTRNFVRGGVLVPNQNNVPVIVPAKSGNAFGSIAPIIIESPSDSYSEVFSLYGYHDAGVAADVQNRMRVKIQDTGENRILMNRSILVNHVFGSVNNPLYLDEQTSEPLILRTQQVLSFEFTNWSTAGSSNFNYALGARFFQAPAWADLSKGLKEAEYRRKELIPYWFTSDQDPTINVGTTAEVLYTVQSDKKLILTTIFGSFISSGAAGEINEGVEITIYDENNRKLMNRPVTLTCLSGLPTFSMRLPTPFIVSPNSVLRLSMRNLITDASVEPFVTFFGAALYV